MELLALVIFLIAIGVGIWFFGGALISGIGWIGTQLIHALNGEMSRGGSIVFGVLCLIAAILALTAIGKILAFYKRMS